MTKEYRIDDLISSEELYHHGIKGQKWGRRRYQNKDGSLTAEGRKRYADSIADTKVYTKKGVEVALRKQPTPLIGKIASKLSKSAQENIDRSDFVDVTVGGKRVGDLQLYKEDPKSINVVWVSIDTKHEGNGYGQAVMSAVVDHAKKQNLDRVTLEVPSISPNARHIYESLGFKAKGVISDEDDAWGGLTAMELDLRNKR
jgi:ribosomal protein S18 acetylase RimI-like enzyme